MSSHSLIQAAKDLVESADADDPHNSHFRRAVSTAYYALFHCLAESSANLLAGVATGNAYWHAALPPGVGVAVGAIAEPPPARLACRQGRRAVFQLG